MHRRLSLAVLLLSASLYGMGEHQQEKDTRTVLGRFIDAAIRVVSAEELPSLPKSDDDSQEKKEAPESAQSDGKQNSQEHAQAFTRFVEPQIYYAHACMGGGSARAKSGGDSDGIHGYFP